MNRNAFALFIALALQPQLAHAYGGFVVGSFVYRDYRFGAADPGDGPFTTAMENTLRPLGVAYLYLEDADTAAILGIGSTNINGNYTIAWQSGNPNPRINVRFRYESAVRRSDGSHRFRIAQANSGYYQHLEIGGRPTTLGILNLGQRRLPDDPHTKLGGMFATATQFWSQFGSKSSKLVGSLSGVEVLFPVPSAVTGETSDRHHIKMADNQYVFNMSTLAHEFGHIAHLVAFDGDTLASNCSLNGATHSWDSVEWESCAFSEGFADFVAGATIHYQSARNPRSYGQDIERARCTGGRHQSESNTARLFWDQYDTTNEAGDLFGQSIGFIVYKLDVFPLGPFPRQTLENALNPNGTNAWDYQWHTRNTGSPNYDITALLSLNCVDGSMR